MLGKATYPTGGIDLTTISSFVNFDYTPYLTDILNSGNFVREYTDSSNLHETAPSRANVQYVTASDTTANTKPKDGELVAGRNDQSHTTIRVTGNDYVDYVLSNFDPRNWGRRLLQQTEWYSDVPRKFWAFNSTYCDRIMLHYGAISPVGRSVLEQVHVSDCEARALAGAGVATRLHLPPLATRLFVDWHVLAWAIEEAFTRVTRNLTMPNITIPTVPNIPGVQQLREMDIPKSIPSFRDLFQTNISWDKIDFGPHRKLLQTFGDYAMNPWKDVAASEVLVPSDVYTVFKGGVTGTCTAGSVLLDGFIKAANNLNDAFTYNVNRAVCKMTKDASKCPSRPLPTSPSTSPGAKTTATTAQPTKKSGNGLADSIIGFVNSALGVDILRQADNAINYMFSVLPNRQATTTAQHQTAQLTSGYLSCDYDAVQCKHKRTDRSVITSMLEVWLIMGAAGYIFGKLFFNLGFTYNVLCLMLIVPITFKVHYGINFGCAKIIAGAVPVCVADDVVDTIESYFTNHIQWPGPLINNHARLASGLLPESAVVNCADAPYGFVTAERSIFYALEKFSPGWRNYISGLSVGAIIGQKAASEMSYYLGKPVHTEPFPTCFYLTLVNAIPLILILIIVLIFLVGAVQVLLTAFTSLFRALDDLVILLALLYAETILIVERKKKEQ